MSVKEKIKKSTNNSYKNDNTYVKLIIPNQKAKQIYSKVFGQKFSNDFYLSSKQLCHIETEHPEVEIDDIIFSLNNPHYITQVIENNQANIISKLGNGKYIYILVYVKLNHKTNKKYYYNGILSARYLNEESKCDELKRNKIIYEDVD